MRAERGQPSGHGAATGDAVLGPSRWGAGSACAPCRGRERRRGRRVDSARAALDLVLRSTKARAGRLYSTRATSRTRLAGSWQREVGSRRRGHAGGEWEPRGSARPSRCSETPPPGCSSIEHTPEPGASARKRRRRVARPPRTPFSLRSQARARAGRAALMDPRQDRSKAGRWRAAAA